MGSDGRAVVESLWNAIAKNDLEAVANAYAEDAVQEWPQSGERIVGRANIMAINESYPGQPEVTIRRINGSGDLWVTETTLDYGGDRYECVSIVELSNGKVVRETDYFGAPFEAPAWRAQWTERI
jgi:limonene-1,2-epoxide hydrolase